ncbi:O-antigen ligase [Chromohalobacter marismortui]|uniref:O-antigen ligase n=1 Tax=Chromohalobacter marismortui TaxID=42055 RepID=A0A4R7NWT5_9GAMM|nr:MULTISPECIES: O-antigen ligase family protein [Chromohalobacter]MCI0510275.1 O-antigen ligase family protein [Chromohalobacter sp.]TDU25151.1 O-antigen ligase [Chromohalobacter marismortui]
MLRSRLWEPSGIGRSPGVLVIVGVATLLVYGLLRVLWPAVGSPAGTAMALLGLIAVLTWGREIRGSGPLWLLLLSVAVQVLSWVLGYFHHPEWVSSNPEVDRLAKLFIFIAVAWWLGGSTRNTMLVWGLAVLGYLVASFVAGGLDEWREGLEGVRTGFGIRNKQHGSMLFGVALLGLVIFARRIMTHDARCIPWRCVAWVLALGICVVGIAIGQTRAVWLALAVSLPVAVLIVLLWARSRGMGQRMLRPILGGVGVGLVLVVLGGVFFGGTLSERLETESGVVVEVLQGDLQNVPYSSVGIRIHTWVAAGEWIAERPLVGWGGEGRSLVIDHTAWLPDNIKERFGHLHNFFLEVWVAYGVLGLGVIAALALWIGRGTWLAWRAGVMPNDMALFGAAFFVYWMIVNQFESYNSFWTGVYMHNLIVGGLVTHIWRWQLESGRRVFAWPTRRSP